MSATATSQPPTTPPQAAAATTAPAQSGTAAAAPAPAPATTNAPAPAAAPAAEPAYEFKAPEGKSFDADTIGVYTKAVKELGIKPETAQKLLEQVAPAMESRAQQQLEALKTQWADEVKADKTLGGDKLAENLAVAKKALTTFASPAFAAWLDSTGLGNHPEMIRLLHKVGGAISGDKFVAPSAAPAPTAGPSQDDVAAGFYPTMKKS